ncbi:MAG: hypothetical protein B9S33_03195 [Pedosphaera sp. Tous-C6FEB]|nr:MAG: hypothetical protein B9S33_03195 [Pedosphaera sp. Tous-C6FEB]
MVRSTAVTLAPEMTAAALAELCRLVRTRAWPGGHLEIGTAAGGTLCELMAATPHQPPFVVVDPMTYFPDQRRIVERNLAGHGLALERVSIREMRSQDAYQQARQRGERFDFMLVDGAHKFRHVLADLRWANLLTVGGVLTLHDYDLNTPGVIHAADDFLARNRNYCRQGLTDSLLIIEKTGADAPGGVRLMPMLTAWGWGVYWQWRTSWRKRFK